jgi:hypothetical protein
MKLRRDNKSGHAGICWSKDKKRWRAFGWKNNRFMHVGYFIELKDAIRAKKGADSCEY